MTKIPIYKTTREKLNLTNISQMIVIIFMMFTSPATGFAASGAFIKGITGHRV